MTPTKKSNGKAKIRNPYSKAERYKDLQGTHKGSRALRIKSSSTERCSASRQYCNYSELITNILH
jgi:hypothetical protein